jgi:hypothetical protein
MGSNGYEGKSSQRRFTLTKGGKREFTGFEELPIIFLDIDGVLNNYGSITAFGSPHEFDPVSVSLMRRLCDEAGAKIVVASAWRPREPGKLPELVRSLAQAGAAEITRFIIGYTDTLISGIRGAEVAKWRRDNKHVGPYVIFDDDSDFFPDQPLVQTSQGRGFGLCEYVRGLEIIDPLNHDITRLSQYVGMKLGGQRADWYSPQQFPARQA